MSNTRASVVGSKNPKCLLIIRNEKFVMTSSLIKELKLIIKKVMPAYNNREFSHVTSLAMRQ